MLRIIKEVPAFPTSAYELWTSLSHARGSPLPHQRDVDAVGSCHGRERHVPADEGWQVLGGKAGECHEEGLGAELAVPGSASVLLQDPEMSQPHGEKK